MNAHEPAAAAAASACPASGKCAQGAFATHGCCASGAPHDAARRMDLSLSPPLRKQVDLGPRRTVRAAHSVRHGTPGIRPQSADPRRCRTACCPATGGLSLRKPPPVPQSLTGALRRQAISPRRPGRCTTLAGVEMTGRGGALMTGSIGRPREPEFRPMGDIKPIPEIPPTFMTTSLSGLCWRPAPGERVLLCAGARRPLRTAARTSAYTRPAAG